MAKPVLTHRHVQFSTERVVKMVRRGSPRGPACKTYYFLVWKGHRFLVAWRPGGVVQIIGRYSTDSSGRWSDQPEWKVVKMSVRKVKAMTAGDLPAQYADPTLGFLAQIPALVAHTCMVRYPDGEPRKPGRVAWWSEGAEWCVRVSDPDSEMSFVAKGTTLPDALLTAELWYTGDKCPWAPDSFLRELAARKKKK